MVIKTMNTSEEAKQRAKNYMKLKSALEEKEETKIINDYGLLPPERNEIDVITERINEKFNVNYFMSEQYKADIKHYNYLMNKRYNYEDFMFQDYLETNYTKKEAHFPLSEPKAIYISKQTHHEVSLERIKELFNIEN